MMKHLFTFYLFLLISGMVMAQEEEELQESFPFSDCTDCSDTLMATYKRIKKSDENIFYKAGYYNRRGQLVIPRIYDKAEVFIGGQAIVAMGGKFGVIDMQGKLFLPLKYSGIFRLGKIGYSVDFEDHSGLLDFKGKELIPIMYQEVNIWSWTDSLFEIKYKGKIGFYDLKTHRCLMPPRYTEFQLNYNAIMAELYPGKIHWYHYPDFSMVDSTYQNVWSVGNGIYAVKKNNLVGMVDSLNHVVIPMEYQGLYDFQSHNLLVGIKNGKKGLITYDNRIVQDFIYDDIINTNARSELLLVKKDGLFGILNDSATKLVVPCIYKRILAESRDSIYVKNSIDLYGIIKRDGSIIENCAYDFSIPEHSSYNLIYRKGNKYGLFDCYLMKFLTKPEFDEMKLLSFAFLRSQYLVRKGKDKMVLDDEGKFKFKANGFDEVIPTSRFNVYIAVKNKKYGLINENGKVLLPFIYEQIIADEQYMIYVLDKGKYYQMSLRGELEVKLTLCEE